MTAPTIRQPGDDETNGAPPDEHSATSLRSLLADVLAEHYRNINYVESPYLALADALLMSPLADILDLAAFWMPAPEYLDEGVMTPAMEVLLEDWRHRPRTKAETIAWRKRRASRAERPTP